MNRVSRANLCARLSGFFKPPDRALAGEIADGKLAEALSAACDQLAVPDRSPLARLTVSGDVLAALENAYQRVFGGPLPPYVVPVESVYKPWTSDPECRLAIAGASGYLMGDPAVDMIRRYQAHGLLIPDRFVSMPDHIVLELEFLAFLFLNRGKASQREFIAAHLDWTDRLAREIRTVPGGDTFYAAAAEITAHLIPRLLPGSQEPRPGPRAPRPSRRSPRFRPDAAPSFR